MARQKGIVPLVRTIGGVIFYIRKGVAVARKAGGGFNRQAIKKAPGMVRVRENNKEFGHCSRIKKEFRLALSPMLKHYKEGTLHGRMMQLFQKVKDCDPVSERGQRKVGLGLQTAAGKQLIRDFLFTPGCQVGTVMPRNGVYHAEYFSYHTEDFDIRQVRFPKGATHLELVLGVLSVITDSMRFDLHLSNTVVLGKDSNLKAFSLSTDVLRENGRMYFSYLGLTFYQEIGGVRYVLKEEGNIGIEWVGE